MQDSALLSLSDDELAGEIAKRGLASESVSEQDVGYDKPKYPLLDEGATALIEMGVLRIAMLSRDTESKNRIMDVIERTVPLWRDGL